MINKITTINGFYYLIEDETTHDNDTHYYIGYIGDDYGNTPSFEEESLYGDTFREFHSLKLKYNHIDYANTYKIFSYKTRSSYELKDRKNIFVFKYETKEQEESRIDFMEKKKLQKEKKIRLAKKQKKINS